MSATLGSRPPRLWECCVLFVCGALVLADRGSPPALEAVRGSALLPSLFAGARATTVPARLAPAASAERGSLRVLTYNIAGLPAGISRSRPNVNVPLISPLLNAYDLVLVQEDFAYQAELRRDVDHEYQSPPQPVSVFDASDGLSRFARQPFEAFVRESWRECHGVLASGSDCLARKGFSVATHELAPGGVVDVYNLHMDAGGGWPDRDARQAQIEQLIEHVRSRSAGRAVIVAGDTNMRRLRDASLLQRLLDGAALRDSCRELECPDPGRVDRVLYRSSPSLELSARSWRTDPTFRDADGRPLSDHRPVAVLFDWQQRGHAGRAPAAANPRPIR